jgi:heterotetrameric sarcosine oxidase delta subunit
MRIACPWCGPRPLHEFDYQGDASKKRPVASQQTDLSAWVDYVYSRDNPAGPHKEYWQHVAGCRSWLAVTRDTTTHEITNIAFARPPLFGHQR